MESAWRPNFHNGQFLIVNRFAYCPGLHFEVPLLKLKLNKTWCLNQPKRGDVVVFEYPLDTSRDFIKRVIALPGETVEVKSGQVYVNGTLMPEPFRPKPQRPQLRSAQSAARHDIRDGR